MSPQTWSIEITDAEILEDLCWPGPPPSRWQIPDTAHIDRLIEAVERSAWPAVV